MKNITIRDLRTRPRQARQGLHDGEEALLTSNGRPLALMVPVSSETLDETLLALRRAKAQMALAAIRSQASSTGADRLSLRAIDKIVGEVRQGRGPQRRATGR